MTKVIPIAYSTTVNITLLRVQDLLCCALEGGSNYWYQIVKFIEPETLACRAHDKEIFRHLDYPVNVGGALIFQDNEGDPKNRYRLDLRSIEKGLKSMANNSPEHFASFIAENEDADTGDVFLQHCLFGEVVYG